MAVTPSKFFRLVRGLLPLVGICAAMVVTSSFYNEAEAARSRRSPKLSRPTKPKRPARAVKKRAVRPKPKANPKAVTQIKKPLQATGIVGATNEEPLNICGLTLNSSTEIDLYREHYGRGSKPANFIELTDFISPAARAHEVGSPRTWLRRACRAGVRCDVLLVSGHFAGEFFGRSQTPVSLEDLEELSCLKECDGIFKQPKEVMLLGCNTLAGKGTHRETMESYMRRLTEHYSDQFLHPSQIERVAAFRYLPFGMSYADRMRSIFDKATKVYGFDTAAPTGPQIRPLLTQYLRSVGPDYGAHLSSLKVGVPNHKLASVLRHSTFIELDKPATARAPVCVMKDKNLTSVQRLEWIEKTLLEEDWISYAPAISRHFHEIVDIRSSQFLDPEVIRLFQRIRTNHEIYKRVVGALKNPQFQKLISIKFELVHLLEVLGFDAKTLSENYRHMIISEFPRSADEIAAARQDVCAPAYSALARSSLRLDDIQALHLTYKRFPKATGQTTDEADSWFTKVLSCVAPTDPEVIAYVTAELEKEARAPGADLSASVFSSILVSISEQTSIPGEQMRRLMSVSSDMRVFILESVVSRQKSLDSVTSQEVLRGLQDASTRSLTLSSIGASRPQDLSIQRYLIGMHKAAGQNEEMRETLRNVMRDIEPTHAEIQIALAKIYLTDGDRSVDPRVLKHATREIIEFLNAALGNYPMRTHPTMRMRVLSLLIVAQPMHQELKTFAMENLYTQSVVQRRVVEKILSEALEVHRDENMRKTLIDAWNSGKRVPGMASYFGRTSHRDMAMVVRVFNDWGQIGEKDPVYQEILSLMQPRLIWRHDILNTLLRHAATGSERLQLDLIEYFRMADIPEEYRVHVVRELERVERVKPPHSVRELLKEVLPTLRVDAGLKH